MKKMYISIRVLLLLMTAMVLLNWACAPTTPEDTTVNTNSVILLGTKYSVTNAAIYYIDTNRYITLYCLDNLHFNLSHAGMTNEIPAGNWTISDLNYLEFNFGLGGVNLLGLTPTGNVQISGTDGGIMTVSGNISYTTNSNVKQILFHYMGPYDYLPD